MTEIVNGIVIGEISAKYVILYDKREQHSWTDVTLSREDEKKKANEWIQEQKNELGQMLFDRLFPDDKWELRIYN